MSEAPVERSNPPVPGTTEPRAARRRRWRWWLIGVAVVVVAMGAGWFVWDRVTRPVPPVIELDQLDPDAAATIRDALSAVAKSPRSDKAWGRLGIVLFANDFYAESLTCLEQAEKLDEKDPRWPYFEGLIVYLSDREAGLAHLRRAAERAGSEIAPRLRLAECLVEQEQLDEAHTQLQRVLRMHPGNPRALLGLGQVAVKRDRLEESLSPLQQAAESGLSQHTAHALLAQVYRRLGNDPAATEELQRAADVSPDPPWPDPLMREAYELRSATQNRIDLAAQLMGQRRLAESVATLEDVLRRHPESGAAHEMLGRVYHLMGDLAGAERELLEAVSRQPDLVHAWFLLGTLRLSAQDHATAAGYYRKAATLMPSYAMAHYKLATCLEGLGKGPEAVDELRTALRYRPGLAEAHAKLGELLAERREDAEALTHLEQAVRLAPAGEKTKQLRDLVRQRLADRPD